MQIVFSGDNFHDMPNPIFCGKIKNNSIDLSFVELAQE